MMMTNGFGMGGSVFMALFILVFLAILGTFLAMLLRGISQWSRDNRSPRLTVGALVTLPSSWFTKQQLPRQPRRFTL